jgi:hypothetical protein
MFTLAQALWSKLNHNGTLFVVSTESLRLRASVAFAAFCATGEKLLATVSIIDVKPCGKPHLRAFPSPIIWVISAFLPDFDC